MDVRGRWTGDIEREKGRGRGVGRSNIVGSTASILNLQGEKKRQRNLHSAVWMRKRRLSFGEKVLKAPGLNSATSHFVGAQTSSTLS